MTEDHDRLIRLDTRFDDLAKDVGEMRDEFRECHKAVTGKVDEILSTLARNGINGTPRPADPGRLTLSISRRSGVITLIVLLLVLTGAVGLKVDWDQVDHAASVATKMAPP